MGDKSNLIINEYIRPDSIPKFVRINNDTVVNTSHIVSINREWINSYAYSTYMEQYSDLMKKEQDELYNKILFSEDNIKNILQIHFRNDKLVMLRRMCLCIALF